MQWNRRQFLNTNAMVMAGLGLGLPRGPAGRRGGREGLLRGGLVGGAELGTHLVDETLVKTLALRGVEAAKAAGATYADVHITRRLTQGSIVSFGWSPTRDDACLGVGVRALVNGCWGFSSSSYWDLEDITRMAQEAVRQASANARATPRTVEWAPIPIASGTWRTPIEVDPFDVSLEEKIDLWKRFSQDADNYIKYGYPQMKLEWKIAREERAVATTEGAYFLQTLYQSGVTVDFHDYWNEDNYATVEGWHEGRAQGVTPGYGNGGWERIRDVKMAEQIPELIARVRRARLELPELPTPGDVGRYDVVFDAGTMGQLVNQTIGAATELDRALGYEANAGGTSYLSDPLAMLGSYQVGAPLLTVTANRSDPHGLATVKWDDEGVEPEDFTLVKDGVLMDYQTTREQAAWLAPWYQKQGRALRSHGCAWSDLVNPEGLEITMQHRPNLVMAPAREEISFADLVKDTKRGIAVVGGQVRTDFQARNGVVTVEAPGYLQEITNGKLGDMLSELAVLFNTQELWKNLVAIGGPASMGRGSAEETKGQPAQHFTHSVSAVPAKIKNMAFIDPLSKA